MGGVTTGKYGCPASWTGWGGCHTGPAEVSRRKVASLCDGETVGSSVASDG